MNGRLPKYPPVKANIAIKIIGIASFSKATGRLLVRGCTLQKISSGMKSIRRLVSATNVYGLFSPGYNT